MDSVKTTQSAIAAPIVVIFRINDDLLLRALGGLGSEELWHRPTENNNPMLWIVGRIIQTRADMLALMGIPFDTGWRDLFSSGSSVGDPGKYPSIGEIKEVSGQVNQTQYATLESLDDKQLAQPFPGRRSPNVKTAAEQLAGFALHDCYHVGQLGYVRKGLGYSAIAG
jgi:hypothetical protein